MIRILTTLGFSRWTMYLVLFGLCLSAQDIEAFEDGLIGTEHPTVLSEQTETDEKNTTSSSPLIATKTFSFDDVYKLELQLDIPGNVRILSIDSNVEVQDTISVTLEKRVLEKNPIFTLAYLEDISIAGSQKDGVLELNSQLPEDTPDSTVENGDTSDIKNHLRLNYEIKTPPDISVNLKIKGGDVYIHHLRGTVQISNESGDVHLDETSGNYQVETDNGRIHGQIMLTPGENRIKTRNGSIDLSVLDELAVPLDLTALGGYIRLLLPENYPADVELNSEKHQYLINLPAEIEDNFGVINGGGPLLRLTATDTITMLQNPRLRSVSDGSEQETDQEMTPPEVVQSVPSVTLSPTIDGNLSEKSWLYAAELSAFQDPTGSETVENQTDVFLMFDPQYFYIGARAYIQSSHVPRVSQTQLDSPIWEDDSIEILLDMDPETKAYSHLIINPISALFDQFVTQVGFPNFRFAPRGVKREKVDESVQEFKADSAWNSNAKVGTKIYTDHWSLEVAIPRKACEKDEIETWLFNVFRNAQVKQDIGNELNTVVQREYSYWRPIYDEEYPWWPHWLEGMGKLKLIGKQSSTDSFDVTDYFIVSTIEIEGNNTIPTEVLLKQIPISTGDTITNEQLTHLLSALENLDWFEKVELKTVAVDPAETKILQFNLANTEPDDQQPEGNDIPKDESLLNTGLPKVTVRINVTESPVQFANKIDIVGNRSFPELFIKRWFDLFPGYYPEANISLKQQMLRDFYFNRGFSFVDVTHEYTNEQLQFNINEGNIDEIRFTGNRRISPSILKAALDLDTESIYFHSLGQTKVNEMQKKLKQNNDAFKSIGNWQAQREGGKNVLIVDIIEHPFAKPGWFPVVGFNRIHGLMPGAGGTLSTHLLNEEHLFGSVSLGISSRILNYQVGVENTFLTRFPLTIGVGAFKLTNKSINDFRLLPAEFNLSDSFYGTSLDHFFQRQGEHVWIANRFGRSSQLRLEYIREDHDNLFKSTDWSYYNRSKVKLGNFRIMPGKHNAVSLRYTFDTRDEKSTLEGADNLASQMILRPNQLTRRGWRGNIGIEKVGGFLGGDFTYNSYNFEMIRYTPLIGKHNLNVRLIGDFTDGRLPTQRLLYLGGGPTLRGYRHNAFVGDGRLVLNIEHRLLDAVSIDAYSDVSLGWAFSSFVDIGQVWWYNENPFADFSLDTLKLSAGLGFSLLVSPPGVNLPLSTVFEFAIPLNVEPSTRQLAIIWRFEQMF